MKSLKFHIPPIYAINEKDKKGNIVRQLLVPARMSVDVEVEEYKEHGVTGYLLKPFKGKEEFLVVTNSKKVPGKFKKVIRIRKFKVVGSIEFAANLIDDKIKCWEKHPLLSREKAKGLDYEIRKKDVLKSWINCFSFKEERKEDEIVIEHGLRSPQIGAIHATLAHWSVYKDVATIVIPTGVGKTETMISLLVHQKCKCLLTTVPTDALRTQIAQKFNELGILKEFGIASESARYPIVGILKHKLGLKEIDEFLRKCNVVVTTMNIAGQSDESVQERMASLCSHLFIDEAHHTEAATWKSFKRKFKSKNILQFTATPFRNDGRELDGEIIYNYHLRKAQEEGYYKEIEFIPIYEYNPKEWDKSIAESAVLRLQHDLEIGFDHILMARVGSIKRAKEVFDIYKKYKQYNPVQIHSGISPVSYRERIRNDIIQRKTRIVVCVDMLGEGFDLPELKIAAFHDIRKSLPITLQIVGRFIRAKEKSLGCASIIANIGNQDVNDELRDLYAQGADWNLLLSDKSRRAIGHREDLWSFVKGFKNIPEEIPLQNIVPALSAVIYRTKIEEWNPENFAAGFKALESFDKFLHDINSKRNTLIIITGKKIPLIWGKTREFYDWNWSLYIVYWNSNQNLLFLHSSNTNSYYKDLAEAVAGDVELITGRQVFRCLAGVNRLKLHNVGLKEQLGKLISYIMRMGSDIAPALTHAQKANTIKAVIFGSGYEDGCKTSIGCSVKGRVWSHKRANLLSMIRWCNHIGYKILDESINADEILKGTLIPETVGERPTRMPIGIDWPEELYKESESAIEFRIDKKHIFFLYDTEILLKQPSKKGDIEFAICANNQETRIKLTLFMKGNIKHYKFVNLGKQGVLIRSGNIEKEITEFFDENPPIIWFSNGSSLEGNRFTPLKKTYRPYERRKIMVYDWAGINIRKESQGLNRKSDSVQYQVIENLKNGKYDIIFDDDGTGEVADVVAIKVRSSKIFVELYHCKYSKESTPGSRIDDLYEVCGQAQKSIHWKDAPTEMLVHLLTREQNRKQQKHITRFEIGDFDKLIMIKEKSRTIEMDFSIFIVQPGLSRERASEAQLELLSVTENYLMETYKIPFGVIASK